MDVCPVCWSLQSAVLTAGFIAPRVLAEIGETVTKYISYSYSSYLCSLLSSSPQKKNRFILKFDKELLSCTTTKT